MKTILRPSYFETGERSFVEHHELKATLRKTDNDICIATISSPQISLEILPFQGQQIWKATIGDRNITMKSEVDEPVRTTDYLRNYGAFLVHCGATAMGGPSPEDTHPLHGELPNAVYNSAWIETGDNENGEHYIEIHGNYKHQVAMTVNYVAHPVTRITQGDSLVHVSMNIENKSKAAMDFMYLAHLNFVPVLGSKIEATHLWDTDSVQVRSSFPAHIQVPEETKTLLKALAENPELSSNINPDPAYDPEAVMSIKYLADEKGFAHTLQVHPDGISDYVRHFPASAPNAIRCIQLTDHHSCVGIAMPATAGVEGYKTEKANGNVISISASSSYEIAFDFASLDIEETNVIRRKIGEVLSKSSSST